MAKDFQALARNNTLTLIQRSSFDNVINCKWVFKVKQRDDGTVEWLKACLVAIRWNNAASRGNQLPWDIESCGKTGVDQIGSNF